MVPAMRTSLMWSAFLGCMLLGANARAGNDDELFVGNRAAMTGGAVSATVMDSSAIWYNPAGLGAVERDQIDVSATAYTFRIHSVARFLSTAGGDSKDGAVTEFVTIPTQIAYVRRLAPRCSLGLGYFVPHASSFVLREGLEVGSAEDGSQWQVAATVADVQHTAAAAIGLALSSAVRVGFSLIGGYAASTQALSLFGVVHQNGATSGFVGLTEFGTASRLSLESGLGLQIDLTREITLGVAGRTPRIQLYQKSDVSMSEGTASLGGQMGVLGAAASEPAVQHTGLEVSRAGRAGVAVAYRYEEGWVSGEVDIQPGLHREAVEVNRKAVVNARLGIYHAIVPTVAIGAGLFTDRAPDAVTEGLLFGSGDFYGGSVGVEFNNEHRLAEGEAADSLIFSAAFALRYAFSNGDFGRVIVDPDAILAAQNPFQAGHGTLRTREIGLYVGSGLHF